MASLTFAELRRANVLRSIETFKRDTKRRNITAFALGMGEEAGEVLGAVRALIGITKRKKKTATPEKVGHEVADTFFYGDLVVACVGLSTEEMMQQKFNFVSVRSGSRYRLIKGRLYRLDRTGKPIRVKR